MSSFRMRAALVAALVLLLSFLAAANFVPRAERQASPLLPDNGLRLGLDLQGGIHWVLGVQLGAAEERELEFQKGQLESYLQEGKIPFESVRIQDGRIQLAGAEAAQKSAAEWAGHSGVFQIVSSDPVTLALSDRWQKEVRKRAMDQVLEVLRRRIDDPAQGIPESVVTKQGNDAVLVQIPGGQIERARARELLKVTGFLEFKIVKDVAATEELLKAKYGGSLPEGTSVAFQRDKETDRVLEAYLVPERPDLTGNYLTDARVTFDNTRRPLVSFQFNPQGGELFEKLSSSHIGERLAIILDQRVYSAPNIRTTIRSRGQIEGRFTPQEAADLATVLRSGSLSVPVVIEEERTVGPALGQDSIDRGVRASLLSLVLTIVFCLVYYRLSGVYAAIALICNMVALVGVMSLFHATLTLPGLGGIALTVGMAVDANVIIFERIREELRGGKTPRAAIKTGFDKALRAILDANVTALITALLLYQYGTGPIKGFGVTLALGIVTSVFAAVVLSRLLFEFYPGNRNVEELSI